MLQDNPVLLLNAICPVIVDGLSFGNIVETLCKPCTQVAENVLRAVEASERGGAPMRFLISCDAADLRARAAESTERCARLQANLHIQGSGLRVLGPPGLPPPHGGS